MKGDSIWKIEAEQVKSYAPLTENIEVDVAIIGGGITGITAAYELSKLGKKIALLEADVIGGATTSMSTGNLYVPVQPRFYQIIRRFNLETAKRIAQSRQLAIDYIENNVKKLNLDCHFSRRPWYALTLAEQEALFLQELEAWKKIGLSAEKTKNLPFDFEFKQAVIVENQARFNPLLYVQALAKACHKQGALIYEKSPVTAIEEHKTFCLLKTTQARIKARDVFMATHTPLGINATQMLTAAYRSYVVGVYLTDDQYPDAQIHRFDQDNFILSTHAIHSNKPEILLIAGSHHRTGQGNNLQCHFSELEAFLCTKFSVAEVAFHWSAQHFQSADRVPYVGLAHPATKHLYMATGYFADGLVYGTAAGNLITHLISKQKDPDEMIYQPKRFPSFKSLPFVLKENGNVLVQYAKDLPILQSPHFEDIAIGEGKIVEMNQEKYAVSRDASNNLHVVSAVCTHMKCIVNWNNAEQTWDCPCHGSRFKPSGEVIEGPAILNLENKQSD